MPQQSPIFHSYAPLATVKVRHGHWLDDGLTAFTSLTTAKQESLARNFQVNSLLQIVPDEETQNQIERLGLVFKTNSSGFHLITQTNGQGKPKVELNPDLKFRFLLLDKIGSWLMASDLPTDGLPPIGGERSLYVFSNRTSSNPPFLGSDPSGFVVDNDRVALPGAGFQEIPAQTIAVLDLFVTSTNSQFSLLDGTGNLVHTPESGFELRFRPRKSTWRYLKGAQIHATTTTELPLTTGVIDPVVTDNLGSSRLPNPALHSLVSDDQDPTKLIAQIYLPKT